MDCATDCADRVACVVVVLVDQERKNMNIEEFIKWRKQQAIPMAKARFGRWWQAKVRALYKWVLSD